VLTLISATTNIRPTKTGGQHNLKDVTRTI